MSVKANCIQSMLFTLILLLIISCHKDNSTACPAITSCNFYQPISTCASYPDTNLAYQLVLGKWYLRQTSTTPLSSQPRICPDNYCISDSTNSLTFLSGKNAVFAGGIAATYKIVPYVLEGYQYFMFTSPACDSTGTNIPYCNYFLTVCDSVLTIFAPESLANPSEVIYTRTWN